MTDPAPEWPEALSSRMHDLLRVATAPAPLAPLVLPATPGDNADVERRSAATSPSDDGSISGTGAT